MYYYLYYENNPFFEKQTLERQSFGKEKGENFSLSILASVLFYAKPCAYQSLEFSFADDFAVLAQLFTKCGSLRGGNLDSADYACENLLVLLGQELKNLLIGEAVEVSTAKAPLFVTVERGRQNRRRGKRKFQRLVSARFGVSKRTDIKWKGRKFSLFLFPKD